MRRCYCGSAKTNTVIPSCLAVLDHKTYNSTAAIVLFSPYLSPYLSPFSSLLPLHKTACILSEALGWKLNAGFFSCFCYCFVLKLLCIPEVSVSTWPFVFPFYLDGKATAAMCNLWHYCSTVLAEICIVVMVVRISISLGSHGVWNLASDCLMLWRL